MQIPAKPKYNELYPTSLKKIPAAWLGLDTNFFFVITFYSVASRKELPLSELWFPYL
jgi:hypothetical protein